MDPNETLRLIRALAAEIVAGQNNLDNSGDLAEHVQALDEWLSKGGFRPREWSPARTFSGQRIGSVEFDLLPNGLTNCPIGEPHTILLIDDHGHTDPQGPMWGLPEPLGGPVPGVNGHHLPERDDDYTPEAVDRDGSE